MSAPSGGIVERLLDRATVASERLGDRPVLVGVSGGVDSVVLLHLLRFQAREALPGLHAVHVDHGLRPDSAGDAAWVRGLCAAWGVPLTIRTVQPDGRSEKAARTARFTAFEAVRAEVGAGALALAHHADDQAETVLHRAVRGTGIDGLVAMTEWRDPEVWRPLLRIPRKEIVAYARTRGISWRFDETNEDVGYARNALRRIVIPALEARVAPGATDALVRLSELALEEREAWAAAFPLIAAGLDVERSSDTSVTLDREGFLRLAPALRRRVLRMLAAEVGVLLDSVGTVVATEFTSASLSGREIALAGGLVVRRELGRVVLAHATAESTPEDRPVVILDGGAGQGIARVGGREVRVEWGPRIDAGGALRLCRLAHPNYPLTVRGRRPGDRIVRDYGRKKLKKVLLEAGVPHTERDAVPVLVDAGGAVLWVPDVETSKGVGPSGLGPATLEIGIADA